MSDEHGKSPRRKSLLPSMPTWTHREPRTMYQQVNNRPRWALHMQATFWRVLMSLGMFFHRLAPPRPPKPNFYRTINTSISGRSGHITLYFYVPSDYNTQKRLWSDRRNDTTDESSDDVPIERNKTRRSLSDMGAGLLKRSKSMRRWGGYPVVINFHGGGFTLGSPMDDARWCGTVVQECNAVVVSVDYRLAPENPFPTAVEDGVDAVVWVHNHAKELGIDTDKIALSGFSSGGNMAFTVPLRLYDQQTAFQRDDDVHEDGSVGGPGKVMYREPSDSSNSASSSTTKLPAHPEGGNVQIIDPNGPPPQVPGHVPKTSATVMESNVAASDIKIRCIIPWYPSLDYTRTREERRGTCSRADQELPAFFTNLFDDSYLHPPKDVSLDSPYLSPGVAPTSLLRDALPDDIIMHTCEWDMLLDEGQSFYTRLTSEDIGKRVHYTMVPGVPHGWDKAPNPWKPTPGVKEYYLKACKEMRRCLGEKVNSDFDAPGRKSIVN